MKRVLGQLLKYSLPFLAVLYLGDWVVLRVRMARQTAFTTVQVDQFLATRLKGNKAEYDYLGSVAQTCPKTIFPHAGYPPCWWVRWHKTQWE